MSKNYLFGPVNSKRFGLSLGIDLSPSLKQCNFDCLYCELKGAKAMQRQTKIVEVNILIKSIKEKLQTYNNKIDVLTITANGEPTMYPHLKQLVDKINDLKKEFDFKLLMLSNASTIYKKEIFDTLLDIDIVKLSLDSVDEKIFAKIDRAHKSIDLQKIIKYIKEFSKVKKHQLVIEILFVKDVNDKIPHLKQLNETLLEISADRIDISTIDRPPAYEVKSLNNDELLNIVSYFSPKLNINIVFAKNTKKQSFDFSENEILNLIKMRPQKQEDIQTLFSLSSKDKLDKLIKSKIINIKEINNHFFYVFFDKK